MFPEGTPTSDISDAHPDLQVCVTPFIAFGGRGAFAGPIRTLACLDDTALLMRLVSEPGNGAVLVVDGEASMRCALLGDRHAETAAVNGWSGIIVRGAVRDVHGLAQLPLGVKGLGVSPRRSGKSGRGAIDIPVRFGDAEFEPGGYVWSDADGILVAPSGWYSTSLEAVAQEHGYAF